MRKKLVLIGVVLLLVALSVRLIPQIYSPLPYNLDGMTDTRIAKDIIIAKSYPALKNQSYAKTGSGYMTYTPAYNIFLAYAAQLFGLEPIEIAQFLTAVIGSVAVIAAFLLFYAIIKNKLAATAGAIFLVFGGTFVFVTAASWREATAFALIPIILYLYYRRKNLSYRAGAVALLVFLIFVHHLATIITYLIVTFVAIARIIYTQRMYESRKKYVFTELATVGVCWLVALFYYHAVKFERIEHLFMGIGVVLFILVIALMALFVIFTARKSREVRIKPLYLLPIIAIALLTVNFIYPIFPAVPRPNYYLLVAILPYFLLLPIVVEGAAKLLYSEKLSFRCWAAALFIAPLTIMLFSFLRKMDVASYVMFSRSFDFIDYGVALAAGIGLVSVLVRLKKSFRRVVCICFIAFCIATTPAAFATKPLLGVQDETYFYEYRAVSWIAEHNEEHVLVSDQRICQLGWRLYDIKQSSSLPDIMANNKTLKSGAVYFAETTWSSDGAQLYPHGRKVINQTTLMNYVLKNNVVYIGGSSSYKIYIFTAAV